MSQKSATVAASPMQSPLIAQMIGISQSRMFCTILRALRGSIISPSSKTSPPGRSSMPFTLPPTLKYLPLPVSSTALRSLSSARSRHTSWSSWWNCLSIWLRESGRFSVTIASLPSFSIFRHW